MAVSVCVLLYGPYPQLAERLLASIEDSNPPHKLLADIRIGVNAVCSDTRKLVWDFAGNKMLHVPVYVYDAGYNVGKYPLMRRMFYDPARPVAERIMWFDDDSYLTTAGPAWWRQVNQLAERHVLVGQTWTIRQRGRQYLGIQAQPWYTGKPVSESHKFFFCTGGWWVADSGFLKRWDYPFLELYHNGGDSILGELVRQQGGKIAKFDSGLVINEGGRKSRRGIAVALREEVYPWQNYADGQGPDLSKHDFNCTIHTFAKT